MEKSRRFFEPKVEFRFNLCRNLPFGIWAGSQHPIEATPDPANNSDDSKHNVNYHLTEVMALHVEGLGSNHWGMGDSHLTCATVPEISLDSSVPSWSSRDVSGCSG